MRYETKWSLYKKVPMVVIEDEKIQLNDSSLIISSIESYIRIPTMNFRDVSKLYQAVIERDQKGKYVFEYPNKYFLAEPLVNDRVNPKKRVQTETSNQETDHNDKNSVQNDKVPNKSFFGEIFLSL